MVRDGGWGRLRLSKVWAAKGRLAAEPCRFCQRSPPVLPTRAAGRATCASAIDGGSLAVSEKNRLRRVEDGAEDGERGIGGRLGGRVRESQRGGRGKSAGPERGASKVQRPT